MTRASFDALIPRLAESPTTISERDLLEPSHWSLGDDARLREDMRFRETPWHCWMLSEDLVANDAVYRWLHAERRGSASLDDALERASEVFGRRGVLCVDDPRFVLRHDQVHLAASELSNEPVLEDEVGDLEKYRTHLPLHSLKAAAASEPAGEWGAGARDREIETLGWMPVSLPGGRLNERMFIAAIEGHSMDDGRSGLVDGGYAVFELWPSGTRQNLNVLVRGAFSDPETGNYAVKRYLADQRDEDGRHDALSLVSLNPNKDRYPDIELRPEDDDDITVVAKVVQALSTDDYERRPKRKRRIGRRDLAGDEQAARLGRRVASFFDDTVTKADDEDTDADDATRTGWQTRLVCLDAAAGGLHLEAGPLHGLPLFVKKLHVVGSEWNGYLLAANAKARPTRLPVRPGTGPWRWEAVDFEEEQELGLDRLALDGFEVTAPIVFRVDSDGVGQRIRTTTLSLGQAYRLLLPPNIGDHLGAELDGAWRLWTLDLAVEVSSMTRQALTALGLDVGDTWPRLEWAMAPASAWRTNARGQSYAVVEVGAELFVSLSGVSLDEEDETVLFLHGPTGTERLSPSANGLVSLGVPAAGQWACALVHSRTSVQPETLLFKVAENAVRHVGAAWTATAPGGVSSLEVTAPPGWPVALRWRVLASHEEPLATLHGSDDRTLPVEDVASWIEDRAARARIADLVVDFGELGRRSMPHDGRAPLKQVREELTALWRQSSELVQSRPGAWLQLTTHWFAPVTALFGYGLEPSALTVDADAPHGLAVRVLTVDERAEGGAITRSSSRILVLTTDIDAVMEDSRAWIDNACTAATVRDAIVTDGTRWTTHRKGSHQLKREVWSLEHVIGTDSIDDMLGYLAEGL